MHTTAVTDNLTKITRLHFVNAFLVREDDGLTLVDTTMGGHGADDIIKAAQQADGSIRRIALTHGHSDHVGCLDALKQRLDDGVEVLIPELDSRIHAGEHVVDGKLGGSWPRQVTTIPDVRLTGGERVGSLEVIPTPGHTPGHVAFLDTRDRSLIAGDVFTTYGRARVTNQFYWRFPLAAAGTWDKSKDLESARHLRELDPALLVVGHGPEIRTPGAAMDGAIARSQSALR
jgi:glyoxylase-like metal-dependent hydrolase (beta-lactamase superfamily II)